MPRVAVRVAYDGQPFHGSQRQPDVRTVEGELLRGLAKVGALGSPEEGRFQCASRTDRGVSAAGNVVAFDTAFRLDALLPALGASTEDVWPYALSVVPAEFDARRARRRVYLYHLPAAGLDAPRLEAALRRFEGTHDFRAFARLEPGVDPVRTVTAVRVEPAGTLLAIRVEGESFLWNQVRRMVEAARRVALGEASMEDLERGLRGERVDLGAAPPAGLVLLDVDHGLRWEGPAAAREAALAQLAQKVAALELHARTLAQLRGAVAGAPT